jgi:hypothetical protein
MGKFLSRRLLRVNVLDILILLNLSSCREQVKFLSAGIGCYGDIWRSDGRL